MFNDSNSKGPPAISVSVTGLTDFSAMATSEEAIAAEPPGAALSVEPPAAALSVEPPAAALSVEPPAAALSAAQLARMERQRLRARALRDARLVQRAPATDCVAGRPSAPDVGGGFLPEDEPAEAPRARPPPAPVADPAERPECLECSRSFAQSYLFDSFEYPVCDDCRDDADAHALVTRTEAKSLYLLKDCDLDLRPPALRAVRRRNPHGARLGDMRLYLRPQVEARALLAWGSERALEDERARRAGARERARHKQTARRLRALRMDVRSSLFERGRAAHEHAFGAEAYDAAKDRYERVCATCGHRESYEKM